MFTQANINMLHSLIVQNSVLHHGQVFQTDMIFGGFHMLLPNVTVLGGANDMEKRLFEHYNVKGMNFKTSSACGGHDDQYY